MSGAAGGDDVGEAVICEHFYAWVSPAGASGSARICQSCHGPDPEWLNHITEVDRGHGSSCLHCEFAPPDDRLRAERAEGAREALEGIEAALTSLIREADRDGDEDYADGLRAARTHAISRAAAHATQDPT